MIGAPIPDQRAAVLAQLNASIDAFFLEGGTVDALPGFEYVPHRPHRDLEVIRASSEPPADNKVLKRQQQLAEIRKLAKTMTYAEAMAHTGLAQTTLYRASIEGCFCFRPDPNRGKGNKGRKFSNAAKVKALAERIIAFRDLGLSMNQARRHMGISDSQFSRITRDFGIHYPTAAEMRAKVKA